MVRLMDLIDAGKTGGAGLIGVILGYLGFKGKVNNLEKKLDSLSTSVRYIDTCDSRYESVKERLTSIETGQGVMQGDIKEILRRLPK